MQRKCTQSSEKEGRTERRSARSNEKKAQSDEEWRKKYVNLAKEKAALENCYNELQVTHMDMEMQHEEQANAHIASFLGEVVIPPEVGSISIRGRQRCSLWNVLSQALLHVPLKNYYVFLQRRFLLKLISASRQRLV